MRCVSRASTRPWSATASALTSSKASAVRLRICRRAPDWIFATTLAATSAELAASTLPIVVGGGVHGAARVAAAALDVSGSSSVGRLGEGRGALHAHTTNAAKPFALCAREQRVSKDSRPLVIRISLSMCSIRLRKSKSKEWCGEEDSNFHGVAPTSPSSWRVYQFRHRRTRGAHHTEAMRARPGGWTGEFGFASAFWKRVIRRFPRWRSLRLPRRAPRSDRPPRRLSPAGLRARRSARLRSAARRVRIRRRAGYPRPGNRNRRG